MVDNENVVEKVETKNDRSVSIDGVTETETSDYFEESAVFTGNVNNKHNNNFESDSEVINSFIKNTSDEVGYLLFCRCNYRLRHCC